MFTPQQIQEISFDKVRKGGYDMDSVDEVLEPLTQDYLTLYQENSVLKSKLRILVEKLEEAGIRSEGDYRSEKLGYKIREAQLQKIPYMLVVGDRDIENGTVSVRTRSGEDLGAMSLDDFCAKVLSEIREKK